VIGLWGSTASLEQLPADVQAVLERAARGASASQRAMGAREDLRATSELRERGMTIRDIDNTAFRKPAERLWEQESRALGVDRWLEAIRA
jgi:TRAP-type C4-dicarboxylate transport system substrate-binding protein